MLGRKKKQEKKQPTRKTAEATPLFMEIVNLIADLIKVLEDIERLYRRFKKKKEGGGDRSS